MPQMNRPIVMWTNAPRLRSISAGTSALTLPPDIIATAMSATSKSSSHIVVLSIELIHLFPFSDYLQMAKPALILMNAWSSPALAHNTAPTPPAASIANAMIVTMNVKMMNTPANVKTTLRPGYSLAISTMCAICLWTVSNTI